VIHRRKGLPDEWDSIAAAEWGAWNQFTADEQERLAGIADWLLRHKHWEAAHGFALDDAILTTIALEAAVPILELDVGYYREVSAIVVYPTTFLDRGVHAGPVAGTVSSDSAPLLGQAHDRRGAVIVAWDSARDAARHPGRGHNVVFHELAHKLDMLDDLTDGTPPLETKEQLARWVAVCTDAYTALREGRPRDPLDPYGAVSPAEFFAVATEAFFDVPVALEAQEPDVFGVLRDFYRQDPAARAAAPADTVPPRQGGRRSDGEGDG
jgi:Mlc titration factor MtfA (ptsG expression regulator)